MKRYDLFRGYEKTYINQEVKIFCNNLLDNKEYKGLFPRINKEIENYIKKTGDQIKRISNVKATITDWQTHTKDGNFMAIAMLAQDMCYDAMKVKYPIDIGDVWGALYKDKDFTAPHSHKPSMWSFIYYIKSNDAPLIVHDAINNSDGLPIDLPIFPKEGDMFIFSSAIRHSVPPIYNQKERIIVAGNFWYNFKKQLKNYERKK